jgi:hypothetical protein
MEADWVVKACPKLLRRELHLVFPDMGGLVGSDQLHVVPVVFKADIDLLEFSEATQIEKDRLLEVVCR